MLYYIMDFECTIHAGTVNSTKFGRLSTTKIERKYAENINLKETWSTPDLKDNPSEFTDNTPSFLQQS